MAERKKQELAKAIQDSIADAKAQKERRALEETLYKTKTELQKAEQQCQSQCWINLNTNFRRSIIKSYA